MKAKDKATTAEIATRLTALVFIKIFVLVKNQFVRNHPPFEVDPVPLIGVVSSFGFTTSSVQEERATASDATRAIE